MKQLQHGVTFSLSVTCSALMPDTVALDQPVCEIQFDNTEIQKTIPG